MCKQCETALYPSRNPALAAKSLDSLVAVRLGGFGTFGAALQQDGSLYTWGTQREVADTQEPAKVMFPSDRPVTVTSFDCADSRTTFMNA